MNTSYGEYNNDNRKKPTQSRSLKKITGFDNSGNRSGLGEMDRGSFNDLSIGSILGSLNKSRNGSVSRFEGSLDCNCGYRSKYLKHKHLA